MKKVLMCVLFWWSAMAGGVAQAAELATVPEALAQQINNLVNLLKDQYAEGYPDGSSAQEDRDGMTWAIFTVEGFGGGNNFMQFLAGFTKEAANNDNGRPVGEHYQFIDVIPIGGGSNRSLDLKQTASVDTDDHGRILLIRALENKPDDAPNFPSNPIIVLVSLTQGRLTDMTESTLRPTHHQFQDDSGESFVLTLNKQGAVLTSAHTKLYLGISCDAYSPSLGSGGWQWSDNGFELRLARGALHFSGQMLPLSPLGECQKPS